MKNNLTFFKVVSSNEKNTIYLFAIEPVIQKKTSRNIFSYYIMILEKDKKIHCLKRIENVSDYISECDFDLMKVQENSEEYLMIITTLFNNLKTIDTINKYDTKEDKFLKPLNELDNLNIKKATTRSF